LILVPYGAPDEHVLAIARYWVDALAREEYASVFEALGYSLLYQHNCSGPEAIERMIKRYRSPDLYPGVETFLVTDWRKAKGGNPNPLQSIIWYEPGQELRGALSLDLPLNGHWSDLQADFVWFESDTPHDGYRIRLEEIGSPTQRQREYADAP